MRNRRRGAACVLAAATLLWTDALDAATSAAPQDAEAHRHASAGVAERFDAAAATEAWRRWEGRLSGARRPALPRRSTETSVFESGLTAGAARAETIELDEPLGPEWVGREVLFAPASRIVGAAELPKEALVVLTAWRSAGQRDEALARCGDRPVMAGAATLAERLGVRRREARAKVLSTRRVEISPF